MFLGITEAGRDYYEVLGLKRNCKLKDIKTAYRKLSYDLHPDKNPDDPEATEKFAEVANGETPMKNVFIEFQLTKFFLILTKEESMTLMVKKDSRDQNSLILGDVGK